MIKVPLYVNASETWGDDLAIPMDFSGRVNMYKVCVVLFRAAEFNCP